MGQRIRDAKVGEDVLFGGEAFLGDGMADVLVEDVLLRGSQRAERSRGVRQLHCRERRLVVPPRPLNVFLCGGAFLCDGMARLLGFGTRVSGLHDGSRV